MNHAAVFTTYKLLIASGEINQFTSRSKAILHNIASQSVIYIWDTESGREYAAPDTAPFFSIINQPLINQDTDGDHDEADEWGRDARYNISNYELWIENQENERRDREEIRQIAAQLVLDDEREQ